MTNATTLFDHSATTTAIRLHYHVAMPQPATHLFEVTLTVSQWSASTLTWAMPVWTPGSYLVREYARHVQEVTVTDERSQALPWRKVSKNQWDIDCPESQEITMRYRVYANELTVRTNHLDATHGYFNGAALFCYIPGHEDCPITVTIAPPAPDWTVFTALAAIEPNTFQAADFDTLVDSPFEIGPATIYAFEAGGKPHQWVIWGDGNYDRAALIRDTQAIIGTEAKIFGGLPYDRYTFLLHLTANNFGGLEHKDCCSLIYSRFGLRDREKYYRFIQLVAHEFFHLWNVKRIRPKALETFDYSQENYTPSLWFCEGVTSYYDLLIPHWAGIYGLDTYLESLSRDLTRYFLTPGRNVQPLSESSFDAWIKLYRRDANSDNSQMSYYLKGQLVSMLLDLQIRAKFENQRSLNDVLRQLWAQFGQPERGYTPAQLLAVLESVAGEDLSEFCDRYLHGLEDLYAPLTAALDPFGLILKPVPGKTPNLGIKVKAEAGTTQIAFVAADGPACETNLDAGDELLALDGWRVTADQFETRLQDYQAGDRVTLSVFHQDQLCHHPITLGDPLPTAYRLTQCKSPTPAQKALLAGWLTL
jgi:predicted metalloprotease with PDZ domain